MCHGRMTLSSSSGVFFFFFSLQRRKLSCPHPSTNGNNVLARIFAEKVLNPKTKFISAVKTAKLINGGWNDFLACVLKAKKDKPIVEEIPTIKELSNVFFRKKFLSADDFYFNIRFIALDKIMKDETNSCLIKTFPATARSQNRCHTAHWLSIK